MTDKKPNRIAEALAHLLEGASEDDILEYLASENVKKPKDVVDQARERIRELAGLPHGERLEWIVEATRHVYSKLIEIGDYAGALAALKSMAQFSATLDTMGAQPPRGATDSRDIAEPSGRLKLVSK